MKELTTGKRVLFLTLMGTLTQLLGFGYRVLLSRMVGAQVMGLYQLIMPVYSVLLSLTAVGLTAAMSNLTPKFLALGKPETVSQLRKTALFWLILLMIPVSGVIILWSDPISVYLLGDARTQLGILLLLPCVALTGIENIQKHVFYGADSVKIPATTELLEQIIRAVAVLGLLVLFLPQYPERALGLVVLGMILCEISSALTLTLLFRLHLWRPVRTPERGLTMQLFTIALPVALTSLAGNLMHAVNAAMVPKKLVESGLSQQEAVSEFGVVCGMTMPMLALPTVFLGAMSLVMIPRLSRAKALGHTGHIAHIVSKALSVVSILTLPSMGLMVVMGEDLGCLLFHNDQVGRHLPMLAVAMILSCYQATLASALNGIGHQGTVAFISILCDVVQLFFTASLVKLPQFGMAGFALGAVVSSALGFLFCIWSVIRTTGMHLSIFSWFTAPALAALLMTLCSNLLMHRLIDYGVSSLSAGILTCLFGVVLYLVTLHAQGVHLRDLWGVL